MPKKPKKPVRKPRKQHPTRPSLTALGRVSSGQVAECIAQEFSIREIHTDRKRFQNRESAFSEATAKSVALRYDPNKFDPIVLWRDPKDGRHYVLSGHSRHAERQTLSESIRKRLRSSDVAGKVFYTEGERKVLVRLLAEAEDERKRIARDVGVRERGLW